MSQSTAAFVHCRMHLTVSVRAYALSGRYWAGLRRALRIVWLGLRLVPPHGSDPESGLALGCAAWVWVRASLVERSASGSASGLPGPSPSAHVLFWAPTGMQDSFHHSGAIVMAIFRRRLRALRGAAAAIDIRVGWICQLACCHSSDRRG